MYHRNSLERMDNCGGHKVYQDRDGILVLVAKGKLPSGNTSINMAGLAKFRAMIAPEHWVLLWNEYNDVSRPVALEDLDTSDLRENGEYCVVPVRVSEKEADPQGDRDLPPQMPHKDFRFQIAQFGDRVGWPWPLTNPTISTVDRITKLYPVKIVSVHGSTLVVPLDD